MTYPSLKQCRLPLATALLALAPAALAATISGTVTNGTLNKPSAGDDVILISLEQRMQEAARTKTDARGHYSLDLPSSEGPGGMHLIRVDHQKAAYFQPAPPNTSHVDIKVYDVAATVPGITTEADVMRIETDPQGLKVTQSYFIKNDSHPPKTQFSAHSYDIYLPPDAKIEGAAAMGPGGMPVASSPAPAGEKGHYAYLFPLRPGETQFQVSYRLPYSGSMSFAPRTANGADNVVVMLPKSMTFKAAAGTPYQPINDDLNAQTFVAKNVRASEPLSFAISGTGALPRDVQAQGSSANQPGAQAGNPQANSAADTRPGGGLGVPIDTPDPLNKYKWWILSGIGLLLAIGAAFFLRKPIAAAGTTAGTAVAPTLGQGVPPGSALGAAPAAFPAHGAAPAGNASVLTALKDELFTLETERMEGKLTEAEYTAHKQALEVVLRRALTR
ncbi:MAG: carboxypeptidase regulatory-like domain-containing protein [Acidobacteriaceae bacterium]